MHDSRAETADDPGTELCFGDDAQVVEVLEDRESGPDRETQNRSVNQEANAVVPQQDNNDQRFERLFDERGDVACVRREINLAPVETNEVDRVAQDCGPTAKQNYRQHPANWHEFVAVEVNQRGQEETDGQQPE